MRVWGVILALLLLPVAGAQADADPAEPSVWILTDDGGLESALDAALAWGLPLHRYERLGMATILAPADMVGALEHLGVTAWPNEPEPLHLDLSVPYVGADRVKEVLGDQRRGPSVLVVDTGIDANHPDFQAGNVAATLAASRSGGLVTGTQAEGSDRSGHGSHVAGIVASAGQALGDLDPRNGRYQGVYSTGRIVSFQASTTDLDPEDIQVDAAAALEAFEWALENRDAFDVRVVSNSWGSSGELSPSHPVTRATLKLYQAGMVVVFSAGNDGGEGTLNRHCKPPWVLCVAAGDLRGTRSEFSSMGPPPDADVPAYEHPDLTAPGSFIRSVDPLTSPQVATGLLGGAGSGGETLYADRSGTSMAAPHVAGAAALVQAANSNLSPDQVMDVLVATSRPMADPVHRVGAGYLDVREAYNLAVSTVGNREAFLAGRALKYAGPAIGDLDYARDPLSVGYDSQEAPRPLLLLPDEGQPSWVANSPVAWVLLGLGVLGALLGVRLRDPMAMQRTSTIREDSAAQSSE